MRNLNLLLFWTVIALCGCGSQFIVKSDPLQADIFFKDPKTGEKKPIGKTPLEMPRSELRKTIGDGIGSGEFFTLIIEKAGFESASFNIPVTGFGTMGTILDVKLKPGATEKEVRFAKEILDHLFLAQKFALSQQYERAHLEIDKLLSQLPGFPRALTMRASIYFAQKNFAESVKWYEEALKSDPQLEDAMRMAAKARALAGGRVPASSTPATPAAPASDKPQGSP